MSAAPGGRSGAGDDEVGAMIVQLTTPPGKYRLENVESWEQGDDGALQVTTTERLYSFNPTAWVWFSIERAGNPSSHRNPRLPGTPLTPGLGPDTTYGLLSGQEQPKPEPPKP